MSIRPFHETLSRLQGGLFIDECAEKLAEAVRAVDETGKAGKLTITLDLKKSSGAIEVLAAVTNKTPQVKADSDLLWPTVDGNLVVDNPRQAKLDLRQVDNKPAEIRSVDPATGEIRTA